MASARVRFIRLNALLLAETLLSIGHPLLNERLFSRPMSKNAPTSKWIANPTFEDYLRAATVAFDARQISQCVDQLGAAMSLDPSNLRAHALVDELLEGYPNLLSLFPKGGEAFFGLVALRALVVSRYDVLEALSLLEEVVAFRPSIPYLLWLEHWDLTRADRQVVCEGVMRLSKALLSAQPVAVDEAKGYRSNLRSLAVVAQRVGAEGAWLPTMLQVATFGLARVGYEQVAADPWLASLATPHKLELIFSLSRFALSEQRYQDASNWIVLANDARPGLPAVREMTLKLIEAGAFPDARKVLSRLRVESPTNNWADAHLEFVDGLEGNAAASHQLSVRAESQDPVALALFKEMGVYREHLPDPFDSGSALVRRSLRAAASSTRDTPNADVQGHVICASARVAYEDGRLQLGLKGGLTLGTVERSTAPSEVWSIHDNGMVGPARLPQDPAVRERIRAIAESPYNLQSWSAIAKTMRSLFVLDLERDVLACFAGVSQQASSLHPVTWLFRVQVASALVLSALVADTKSRSAQMLAELVSSASDWSSAAAALAVADLGLTNREQYGEWAKCTLDAPLARTGLTNATAEHAIVVARSWFESGEREAFKKFWRRRMSLRPG